MAGPLRLVLVTGSHALAQRCARQGVRCLSDRLSSRTDQKSTPLWRGGQCPDKYGDYRTMDDDVLHATMAFLAEFDGGASDDDDAGDPRTRRLQLHAGIVAVDVPGFATFDATRQQSQAKPVQPPVKAKAEAVVPKAKRPAKPRHVDKNALSIAETVEVVPLAQPKTRKEELEFLRDKVKELEEKLRLLKRGIGREDPPPARYPDTEQLSGALALVSVHPARFAKPQRIASMWEDLAMRQYQQRQRAEVENLKLKGSLEDQRKVAKSLQRMLKRSKCDLEPHSQAKRSRLLLKKVSGHEATEGDDHSSATSTSET